jgi:hypothetical protein
MLNNLISKVKDKINTIQEENKNYNNLLEKSSKFTNLQPLPTLNLIENEYKINYILETCPDLNKSKAITINNLIPIDETYLYIYYIKEIITNTEYWLVPTNKYIWIINNNYYNIIFYQNITNCNIVKNNLISKIINLNNIILEINGNDTTINNLISILTSTPYRENIIKEKVQYLCGIIPIYQNINKIKSGISIDKNKNIVFHTKKFNYKYNYQEITNYELLIDNTCILTKNQNSNTKITSFQNTCYTISIRITTSNNKFIIPILESNSLGTKYTNMDSIYLKNINFAKEIINKLKELCEQNYYT